MGIRRWAAVLTGFVGMLVILRPGLVVLEFGSILAVISAVFGAGSSFITKELSRIESVVTITSYSMILTGFFVDSRGVRVGVA